MGGSNIYIIFGDDWNEDHTDVSKYFIQRFAQLVDGNEIITNMHQSTNGLILFSELHLVVETTIKRRKSKYRLKSLLDECLDEDIKSSIKNDFIINKYYRSSITSLARIRDEFSEEKLTNIKNEILKYYTTISRNYINYIKIELQEIDLSSEKFETEVIKIDKLIGIMVSQLIYNGYSLSYLQMIPEKVKVIQPKEIIKYFIELLSYDSAIEKKYCCFIPSVDNLMPNEVLDNLKYRTATLSEEVFIDDKPVSYEGYIFDVIGKDPFSALQKTTIQAYRDASLIIPNISHEKVDAIWEMPFYSQYNEVYTKCRFTQYRFGSARDPILPNSKYRIDTLQETLSKFDSLLDLISIEKQKKIRDAFYFYNLAHIVPSIENSYILLWSTLESLMGLRGDKSDIEVIQQNVGRAIALGSFGRRVNSFVQRYLLAKDRNNWSIGTIEEVIPENSNNLCKWVLWLTDKTTVNKPEDPFNILKTDPLLCRMYCTINSEWEKIDDILALLVKSEKITRYQLDRLYYTRNLIVHSGRSNQNIHYLWVHLEWYVGKLLALFILNMREEPLPNDINPRDAVFGYVQGQFESTVDYLERNKDKEISYELLMGSRLMDNPILCF